MYKILDLTTIPFDIRFRSYGAFDMVLLLSLPTKVPPPMGLYYKEYMINDKMFH